MCSEPIGVLCRIQVVKSDIKLLRILHRLHHCVATQVSELGDMFDVEGADINAGVAGRAGPNCLLCNPVHDGLFGGFGREQYWSVIVCIVTHIVYDLHRIQALS